MVNDDMIRASRPYSRLTCMAATAVVSISMVGLNEAISATERAQLLVMVAESSDCVTYDVARLHVLQPETWPIYTE